MGTSNILTYTKFMCSSMKARISWAQEKLMILGYLKSGDSKPTKRDRAFIDALKNFQKDNGFTTNAEIHEQEFNVLKGVISDANRV